MRFIVVLVALLGFTSAYSAPGAYERIWFYYAYLADVGNGGGVATKVAKGCAKYAKGAPCTFSQFLQYINTDTKATDFGVADLTATSDVEAVAADLQSRGLTGTYNCNKIRSDVGQNAVADLFRSLSSFLVVAAQTADAGTRQKLAQAVTGVARKRMEASLTKCTTALRGQLTIVTRQIAVFDGGTEMTNEVDIRATATASNKSVREVSATLKNWLDDGHSNNIKEIRLAASTVSEACQ